MFLDVSRPLAPPSTQWFGKGPDASRQVDEFSSIRSPMVQQVRFAFRLQCYFGEAWNASGTSRSDIQIPSGQVAVGAAALAPGLIASNPDEARVCACSKKLPCDE